MRRRHFIQKSAVSFPALLLTNCAAKDYDLLVTGGVVYDGLGNPGKKADVAVKGGRIALIAPGIGPNKARAVIDAKGMAVAPGFIDPHTHTDMQLLVNPKAESKIRQGVTTEIGGNCGGSQFPVPDEYFEKKRENIGKDLGIELTWKDARGFFERLEESGMALNYATLLGHGTLRSAVMGPYDRPPTDEELRLMKQAVRENMEAGVLGLSTGLIYTPGSFAETDEIVELCREVAALNGVYATHMRSESDDVLDAVDEAITISRESGVSLQISHLKALNPGNWPKIDGIFAAIEQAKQSGVPLLADRYSYSASSTGMLSFFPLWAREGTTGDIIARLKDPSLDARIRAYLKEQGKKSGSWDKVLISSVASDENVRFEGMTVLEAAASTGKDSYDFMRDLLIEERGRVSVVKFVMSEDNLKRVLAHPLVVVGSDGNALAPYGVLAEGKPHPRSYGTFPRVLGKYVREEKVLTLPEAIMKMTSLTADKFGLAGRGRIIEDCHADLVVFNPDTVIDRATFKEPHQYPEGIEYVIVNGTVVIDRGEHTGALPGFVLRHPKV